MKSPSLTPSEAEAALGRVRGQHPYLYVSDKNLSLVKQWLTAMGVPAAFNARMRRDEMAKAFNDATNQVLDSVKARAIVWQQQQQNREVPAEVPAPVPTEWAPSWNQKEAESMATAPTPAANNDAQVQRIATLLGELLAKPGCDPDMVKSLVKGELDTFKGELPDMIAKHSPTVTVVVNDAAKGTFAPIEGHAHKMLAQVLELAAQNIPVLLVGPAGGGKTTAVRQIAKALGVKAYFQGAASGTHEYAGYKDAYGVYHSTAFRQAYEHGGVLGAEELDSGSADVPLWLNAAIDNGHATFPDSPESIERHPDFRIVANANTHGRGADRVYVGRTQLDGATIDRFAFLDWEYDAVLERKLAGNDAWVDRVQAIRNAEALEKARLIVSPRASIRGAKMIAAGWTFAQCEDAFIWKGADAELKRRILAHIA